MSVIDNVDDFIIPVLIYENKSAYEKSINSQYLKNSKVHLKNVTKFMEEILQYKIKNVLLFGIPKKRDYLGTSAYEKNGVIQKSVKNIRENFGSAFNIICDVCICQYNTTGHCGLNPKLYNGDNDSLTLSVNNDKTLEILGMIALSISDSGANFVAPSSMMDGQVYYIRNILQRNGFTDVKILSYSSKHNSSLYSPFRNYNYFVNNSINKSTYQNSYYNVRESIRETIVDDMEGADWLMVKPSFWYMDIIKKIRNLTNKPLVVQNVSGEYYLVKSSVDKKWINELEWYIPFIKSLKRAGADKIISYFLIDLLKKDKH